MFFTMFFNMKAFEDRMAVITCDRIRPRSPPNPGESFQESIYR